MAKFPLMGVTAVVDGYNDYLRMMGGMSKATKDTHGVLGNLSVIPLAGGLIKGAAMATAAIVGIGTAAVGAGVAIGGMLLKIADEATPLLEISSAFEKLTERAGKSGDAVLQVWQDATQGTVSSIKLMEIYNTAARNLGDTFADKLPPAMRLLKTAAEATGQDFTAFTTTFIKAVGRLRVGTLSQLGILIDLNQLTEDYAKAHGIKADAVSDDTKRTLVYNESIKQLTADVGALMEEGLQADDAFDRLRATMDDAKNEVRIAISKAMLPLATKLGQLAQVYLPDLVKGFVKKLVPALEKTVAWLGNFLPKAILLLQIWWFKLKGAMKPITDYIKGKFGNAWTWLTDKVFPELIYRIDQAVNWLVMNMPSAIETVKRWADKIKEWGQALIDFWNTKVGPKLKAAWDWIEVNISPKIKTIRSWLADKLPAAGATLSAYWNDTLGPALATAWQWIVDNIGPKVTTVLDWIRVDLPVYAKNLSDYWNLVWAPALLTAWEWIVVNVGPKVQEVVDWLQVNIPVAVDLAIAKWDELKLKMADSAGEWKTTILPAILEIATWLGEKLAPVLSILGKQFEVVKVALQTVGDLLSKVLMPIWGAFAHLISAVLVKAFEGLVYLWLEYVLPAVDKMWTVIRDALVPWFDEWRRMIDDVGKGIEPLVGWIHDLAEAIGNIGVPKALQQHSPSPLEKSLMGVRSQMEAINALGMPGFGGKGFSPVLAGPVSGAMAGSGGSNSNYNLTVNTSAPREQITADFGMMRALARRR